MKSCLPESTTMSCILKVVDHIFEYRTIHDSPCAMSSIACLTREAKASHVWIYGYDLVSVASVSNAPEGHVYG